MGHLLVSLLINNAMKTRKYTRNNKGPKSGCSKSGVGPYGRLGLFGPASQSARIAQYPTRAEMRVQRRYVRKQERERQDSERHLPWQLIRDILDTFPAMTLEQAKLYAEETGTI